MKIEYKPLKDLVELVIDYRGKTPLKLGGEWSSSGYRALSALNVKTKEIVAEDKIRYVNEDLYKKWMKEVIIKGDILITSEAPFGQVFQWNSDEKIVLSQRLFALRIKNDYCSSYIFQYMASDFFYGELKARATGSTVEGLRQPALMKCKIAIPSLERQHRIASILSAYDNLIENNNRRIRLLEQMAENLYKEWFVRFRFPGHEKAEFENGLPKGWRIERLNNYGRVETGKTPSMEKPEYYGGNILFIKTPDMHGGIYVRQTEEYLSEKGNNSQPKKLLPVGSIMVSCIGSAGVVSINAKPAHTNQQINSIILSDNTNLEWLYFTCKSLKPTIELFGATGATMTNLSKGKFERLKVIEPSYNLRQAFHNKVSSIFDAILKLDEQTSLLSRQRDLLLPRLMSGKLEVKV